MSHTENDMPFIELTSNEVSNLWSSYIKSSMELRLFEYFYASAENNEIKQVIEIC